MKIILSRAGFNGRGGFHFNPWTMVQPPGDLLSLVFPWVDHAMQELKVFLRASPRETRQTAGMFLQFMTKIKEVVLQDAAAMLILHPDRSVHQIFQMSAFRSDSFKAYDDWSPPALKEDKNERPFETVDNPGGWDRYYFVPRFDKKTGLYQHHSTPTKCRPCPPDPERDGLRTCNGWVFYYQDWKLVDSWTQPYHTCCHP